MSDNNIDLENIIDLEESLIVSVIERIEQDISDQDHTALDELLRLVPRDYLIGYLEEEQWPRFKLLLEGKEMYKNMKPLN